jgi:hypothetical protein
VDTWKWRGKVPHAVISTALLVDAIDFQSNISEAYSQSLGSTGETKHLPSPFVQRSVYSTAFARFITGFCDTPPNAAVKRSMYDTANEISIAEEWVEVRHEITHGEIPDLQTLQTCTSEALEWLWNYYWAPLTRNAQAPATQPLVPVKDLLKALLKARKDYLRGEKDAEWSDILTQILSADQHCNDLPKTAKGLVSNKLLLPKQKLLVVHGTTIVNYISNDFQRRSQYECSIYDLERTTTEFMPST